MDKKNGCSSLGHAPDRRSRQGSLAVRALLVLAFVALVALGGNNWRARAQTNRLVAPYGDDLGGSNDCTSPDQPCATIQHAINQSGPGDLVELASGTYFENVVVSQSVTVQGDGTVASIVDGGNSGPVFTINDGVTATLSGLTITNGNAQGSLGQVGGGVQNLPGGAVTVVGCTISGNQATAGGGGGSGGGIANMGTLTVINSTISGNSASVGGGIANAQVMGTTTTATIVNCTINENSAPTGAGISNDDTLNLTNTIIAGSLGGGGDCVNGGTIGTNNNNLIEDGSCSPALSGDPKLGPLQDNGGVTLTYALMTGSPAIDAGDDSVLGDPLNLTNDQRSFGFPRKECAHVDIGAFEFGGGVPPTISCPGNISVPTDPGQTTATVSFTVSASDVCGAALMPVCRINGNPIASPFAFPVGVTAVTCSVTNPSGLSAVCGFTVSVTLLNACIQDDSSRDTFRFNSTTGQYQFTKCSTGLTLTGTGVLAIKGSIITLVHNAPDRRISVRVDNSLKRGTASVQYLPLSVSFSILDRNILDDTCTCP